MSEKACTVFRGRVILFLHFCGTIRRKLGIAAEYVETVRGVGYCFKE